MFRRSWKKKMGFIIMCIGAGIVITIVVPIWGWIIAVGGGLIYCGWYLMEHSHH